jgi:glycosyltransferase involved in cell wall biosynthesis
VGNPIRVLHVVVNMNRGGAETLLMNLYRNIDRSKIQFDFLTCKEGVFDTEIIQMGGVVHRIPYITEVGHFHYIKELERFFTANCNYKIVHSHMDKMSGFVMREAKRAGIPIRISHSHNTQSEGSFVARLYKWYSGQFINQNTTNFFACSNSAAQWLFAKNSTNSTIIKNGINIEQFVFSTEIRKEVRREFQLDDETIVIGHVGRFCHQKNHSYILDVFSQYHQLQEKSFLILVGDGPLRSEIEQKVKLLKLENKVKILGVRSDINRLLQAFDVFLFPSLHEGLPVSLIEAQGAGVSCLISDQISNEVDLGMDLIEYAKLSDLEDWVQKLQEIISRNHYRKTNNTYLYEKGYDIKKTACDIEDFYLKVMGESG